MLFLFYLALQGPVLSGHKKLIAEKLAEEEEERKVKGDAKKEKHLVFDVKTYLCILRFEILASILHIFLSCHFFFFLK